MAVDIKVPAVGESITEGTLGRWLKKDGDTVAVAEPLFELETDKATGEIPSPAAGVLRIATREGETVAIGAVVVRIEDDGAAAKTKSKEAAKPAVKPSAAEKKEAAPPAEKKPVLPAGPDIALSPAARRLAADKGVDVHCSLDPSAVLSIGILKQQKVDIVCRYPDDQMLTARAITIFDLFTGEVLTHPVTLFFSNASKYNETLYRLHVDCQ